MQKNPQKPTPKQIFHITWIWGGGFGGSDEFKDMLPEYPTNTSVISNEICSVP